MEWIVSWIQEIGLIFLDLSKETKRFLLVEFCVGIAALILGLIWKNIWIVLGLVVFVFTMSDIFWGIRLGIAETLAVVGTVVESKRGIISQSVIILLENGEVVYRKIFYNHMKRKIRNGDRIRVVTRHGLSDPKGNDVVLEFFIQLTEVAAPTPDTHH